MEEYKLFEAEYKFACLIWEFEPINSTELVKITLEKLGWKKSTTYTVLKKLCDRGIFKNKETIVSSIVKREQVQKFESHNMVDKTFGGSLPKFLAAFLDNEKITKKEALELKRIIEEATK